MKLRWPISLVHHVLVTYAKSRVVRVSPCTLRLHQVPHPGFFCLISFLLAGLLLYSLLCRCACLRFCLYVCLSICLCLSAVSVYLFTAVTDTFFVCLADVAVKNLTAKVEAKLGILQPVEFPLPNKDACKNSGLKCPLKANETVIYHSQLAVPKSLPLVGCLCVFIDLFHILESNQY